MVSRAMPSAPAGASASVSGRRERDLMDEVGDDLVDTGPGPLAARQEDESMAERRPGSPLDVDGDDIVPTRGQRHGTRRLPERNRTAGRRADRESGVGAAGCDDVEDVTPNGRGDMDVADAAQQRLEVRSTERRTETVDHGGCRRRAPRVVPRALGWDSPSTGEGGSGRAVPGGVVTYRPHRRGSGWRAP